MSRACRIWVGRSVAIAETFFLYSLLIGWPEAGYGGAQSIRVHYMRGRGNNELRMTQVTAG